MNIEQIVEEAGIWAEPLHESLNYLERAERGMGLTYQLHKLKVGEILTKLYVFTSKDCYQHYAEIYNHILLNNEHKSGEDR